MPDELIQILAKALADLVISIDLSDDEDVPPDVATRWFEDSAHTLGHLIESDRDRLTALWHDLADQEPSPARRQALRELPEGLGLDDRD
ncbi:hypothetical protein J7F03_21795 [Streptomyces sp. ISL-43]|uniref:hypothetical protein n=1 Tax=Streptomyces sp. ISL-43 TaxID=2819183 RepID=UPI001BE8849E|nr:hypothetical protein [Streptomyces sp. ISL-43]MBT2449666.1 hypothetical protein [Streptomyces sp. ISL-43]